MSKYINFLGYSIWITSEADHEGTRTTLESGALLYSPIILASYAFLSPSIGTILYGMNLHRRDEKVKGKFFIALSCIVIFLSMLIARHDRETLFLSKTLIALSLYQLEKPGFNRALRDGFRRARWWPPLIGVVILLSISGLFVIFVP